MCGALTNVKLQSYPHMKLALNGKNIFKNYSILDSSYDTINIEMRDFDGII